MLAGYIYVYMFIRYLLYICVYISSYLEGGGQTYIHTYIYKLVSIIGI